MIFKEEGGLSYCQFPDLAGFREVRHGVFTRLGGVSREPYESLNISKGLGDDGRRVEENRRRLAACFGNRELVFVRQIHGVRVEAVDGGPALKEEARPPPTPSSPVMSESCWWCKSPIASRFFFTTRSARWQPRFIPAGGEASPTSSGGPLT